MDVAHPLWAILLAKSGQELVRVVLPPPATRANLRLGDLASEGLRHDPSAMIAIRNVCDASCGPYAADMNAIQTARRTLGAIGLPLHDDILWSGEGCVSLRHTSKL